MGSQPAVTKTVFFLLAIIAAVSGLTFYQYMNKPALTKDQLQSMGAVVFENPRSFEVKELVNHKGQPFTEANLSGGWGLIYFGYTFCPDICPASLGQLNKLDKALKENDPLLAQQMRYMMVSVDPRRDTVEKLGSYIPYFNRDFVGVTGSITGIYHLTQQLNIAFTPVVEQEDEFYLVDHSANLVIINPRGDYHGFIRPPLEPEKLSIILSAIEKDYRG
ncbi:SCO family protein [Endozoicomonas sp. Mp262]|uniref:SCO family protein n=1 Tax=Endozoicomonas sp. Mp262 TaxID=2919499 RepID=UPI0021DA5977